MTAHPWLPADVRLGDGVDLGGSTRSQVHRHRVHVGPEGWGSSVVVKRFLPQEPGSRAAMGYGRERTALQHLPGVPRLLAADDSSRTLVMEDLGEHATLADVLLGDDPRAAWEQSLAWARALGAAMRSDAETLGAARRQFGPAAAEERQMRIEFPRRGLARLSELGGVSHGAAATAELTDAVDWLEQDSQRHVLAPGDSCPDNALLTPAGVRLVDLEGAGVRHAAYEAAYAAEPFSTCWCVFAPPDGLTDQMLGEFTRAASEQLPGLAEDPAWPRQVRAAVAAWVASSGLWLLDGAVEDRQMTSGGRHLGPAMRALLVARWRWVVRECAEELPDTAAVFDEAITWALRTWGGQSPGGQLGLELAPYPAWARPEPSP